MYHVTSLGLAPNGTRCVHSRENGGKWPSLITSQSLHKRAAVQALGRLSKATLYTLYLTL